MTATMHERTVLPPVEFEPVAELATVLAEATPSMPVYLLSGDGVKKELPEVVYRIIRDVVAALNDGLAITVAPHNTQLTTQEAAEILGLSRPTLVKLLEQGKIPYEMRGSHRRVLLADVLEYRENQRFERRAALRRMAQEGQESGLYDIAIEPIQTR